VRRRPGSWLRFLFCLSVLLAAGPESASAATPSVQHATTGPAASVGDLRFHASAVAFRHGEKQARAEFSIRVPYRQLQFLHTSDRYEAKLRLTVEMNNAKGSRSGYMQREASVQSIELAPTTDSLLGEIYTAGLVVPPGTYSFKVTVEDLNAFRQGLVAKMKKQHRAGVVEGAVDLGAWLFQNPALSGLQFAWEIRDSTGETDFTKGPYEVLPQPSGYYGAFQQSVYAYYEIYDTEPPPEGRSYRLQETITNAAGDTLFTDMDSLRVTEGTAWPHALSIDISTLGAGHYWLTLGLQAEGEKAGASGRGEFDVIWSPDSWSDDAADVYEVTATTLMSSDSSAIFLSLPMGEQERWMERLWRSIDPTPDTAENERRDEFQRRIEYVNANFSVIGLGIYSDRGRVYLRYGEPDDSQIERVPVGTKTLGYSLGNDIPLSSKAAITDTQSGVADMRAYEIWTYEHRGQELTRRYGTSEVNSGLKFVFVDDQGYGDYRLNYSSTTGLH
jgi:GWxTD domain-containing protein